MTAPRRAQQAARSTPRRLERRCGRSEMPVRAIALLLLHRSAWWSHRRRPADVRVLARPDSGAPRLRRRATRMLASKRGLVPATDRYLAAGRCRRRRTCDGRCPDTRPAVHGGDRGRPRRRCAGPHGERGRRAATTSPRAHGRATAAGSTLWPPMKRATKAVRRLVEHLARRARLLDPAVVHHHDEVGQRHRLFLAVRDVDEGDAELASAASSAPRASGSRRNGSSAESGSSSSSTCGSVISARASATRCCWPPESCAGRRLGVGLHLHELEHVARLLARRSSLATPRICRLKATLSTQVEMREQRVGLEHHRRAARAPAAGR